MSYLIRATFFSSALMFMSPALLAQTSVSSPARQATIMRATTGRMLNAQGLADQPVPVRKGFVFEVAEESLADVTLVHNGRKFKVSKSDVSIAEKGASSGVSSKGFQPGTIVLISAKYTVLGNQPRNVKNRLSKLIPMGVVTEPIAIQVTDDLSSLAGAQGNTATTVTIDANSTVITTTEVPKNVLTVEYSFNGQIRKKQALEGSYLVLP